MNMLRVVSLVFAIAFTAALWAGEPVEKAEMISPLLVGMQAPDVTLKTPDGGDWALQETVKEKPTVLIFYRGSW